MKGLLLGLIAISVLGCNKSMFKSKWTEEKAPASYTVRFETSKGEFDVQVNREWSPLAADRFYQLVKHKFYDSALFYRVVPDFVAQFGTTNYAKSQQWTKYKIPDEEVKHSNIKGSLSFARGGKETRGDALFINLKDNPKLDTMDYAGVRGFPSFGNVVKGMDVVMSLYSGFGDKTMSKIRTMYENRKEFLAQFPSLDSIRRAYILKQ